MTYSYFLTHKSTKELSQPRCTTDKEAEESSYLRLINEINVMEEVMLSKMRVYGGADFVVWCQMVIFVKNTIL